MKHICYIVLFLFSFQGVAQKPNYPADKFADKEYYLVDSLVLEELSPEDQKLLENSLKKYHSAKDDTSMINALTDVCENMIHAIWEEYQFFQYELIKLALNNSSNNNDEKTLSKLLAVALNNFGYICREKGEVVKSLSYYQNALTIYRKLGNIKGVATSFNNIGSVYEDFGDVKKAIRMYHESLILLEKIDDKLGQSYVLNNIALVYRRQNDLDKALEANFKSLDIKTQLNDLNGMTSSLNNIGSIFSLNKNYNEALIYFNKTLQIQDSLKDINGMAISLNNIAELNQYLDKPAIALEYIGRSIELYESINDKSGLSSSRSNLAQIHLSMGNLQLAEINANKSHLLAMELAFPDLIRHSSGILSQVYEKQGKGMQALKMHKLYVQMKDSINNEATQKATIRQQTQYEFEKTQIVKENEAKEEVRLEAEATGRRNNLQYSLIFLGILMLFGIVLSLGFIKVSPTIAEGIIFFAFLILFEFVLVFSEPYLEQYTNGEPMYNLLANSVLALVIFPLHAILERLLKKRIVKN